MAVETHAPVITLRQVHAQAHGAEHWQIGWRIENQGTESLDVSAARLPHGQFKAEEQKFEPVLSLAGDTGVDFDTLVRCHEPPGLVTENAFVIFYVNWLSAPWRIFVRVRVEIDARGMPHATVESITTQQVGFLEASA